jgi:uncharacterized protein
MKYLLVFAVVFLVAWRWRGARSTTMADTRQQKANAQVQPTDMVACRQCGLHLPASESLPGRLGPYCSTAHRQAAER